jgi:hypothetical protein
VPIVIEMPHVDIGHYMSVSTSPRSIPRGSRSPQMSFLPLGISVPIASSINDEDEGVHVRKDVDYHDHQSSQGSSSSSSSQSSASNPAITTNEELMEMKRMIAQLGALYTENKRDIHEVREANIQLQNANVQQEAAITALRAEVMELRNENASLRAQLEQATRENDTLREERATDRARILELETERARLMQENTDLREQLTQQAEQLRGAREDLEQFRMRDRRLAEWFRDYRGHLRSAVESSMDFMSDINLENEDSPLVDKIHWVPMSDPRSLPSGHTLDASTIRMILEEAVASKQKKEPQNPFTREKLPSVFSEEAYPRNYELYNVLNNYSSRCGFFSEHIRAARAHLLELPQIFEEINNRRNVTIHHIAENPL